MSCKGGLKACKTLIGQNVFLSIKEEFHIQSLTWDDFGYEPIMCCDVPLWQASLRFWVERIITGFRVFIRQQSPMNSRLKQIT